jgi:hypothetical protein
MFRINYRTPESLPHHQRDFPSRKGAGELPSAEGSRELGLMVTGYVVALLGGIILLGYLTAPTIPNSVTAEILAGR